MCHKTQMSYLFCVASVASLTCVMENCRSGWMWLFRWFWHHWLAETLERPSHNSPNNFPSSYWFTFGHLRYKWEVIKTQSCCKLSTKGAHGKSEVEAVYCIQMYSKIEVETSKETHSIHIGTSNKVSEPF